MDEIAYYEIKISCECGYLWVTMMVPTAHDNGVNQASCPQCKARGRVIERSPIAAKDADAKMWEHAKHGSSAFLSMSSSHLQFAERWPWDEIKMPD